MGSHGPMRLSAWSLRSQATRRAPLRCMTRRPRRRSWVRWRCTASSSSRWSGLVVLVHLLLLLLLRLLLLLLLLLEQVEGAMAALMQLATLDLPGCMEAGLAAAVVRSMHSRLAGGWLQFLCAPARSKVPPRRCYTSLACLGGATACSPGLLGPALPAPGCATHFGRAAQPLSAQWEAAVRPGRSCGLRGVPPPGARTLSWCLSTGGADVAEALRVAGAAEALVHALRTEVGDACGDFYP